MSNGARIIIVPTGKTGPSGGGGGGGGGATNLTYTAAPTGGTVASDTGTDASLTLADGTNAGLMAPAQHTKLAGIEAGATADMTAAEILAALLTVDGTGSGLDADLLDGQSSAAFLTTAAAATTYQPLDSDLTAIAALTTTTFGRSLLALVDAAALRTAAGLVIGTDVAAQSSLASYLTTAAAASGYQPLDSDLSAIAALTTTTYGRALLTLANQAALLSAVGSSSDTAQGVVELATTAETTTGTDATRAVTPAGLLNATTASNINARVAVKKGGTLTAARRGINFIEGSGVTITTADDSVNEEVDVTIAASGGGGGSVATDTIFDAKGDLPVGTGADTAAKLTVGANGTEIFADSNASTGLTYGYPERVLYAAAGAIHYPISVFGQSAQTSATAQECVWWPIFINRRVTLDAISNYCWTLEAGSTLRLGAYACGANATPTTLIADYGTVSGASTGSKSATGSTTIGPGLVFIAAWQSNHTTVRWSRSQQTQLNAASIYGENGVAGGQSGLCWRATGVDYSAGLPASAPALSLVYSSAGLTTAILPGIRFT